MDPTPSRRVTAPVLAAIILTVTPGAVALLGTVLNNQQMVISNFFFSPVLAIASGLCLGLRGGELLGIRVLRSLFWALGAMGVSLGLQFMGCNAVNYRF